MSLENKPTIQAIERAAPLLRSIAIEIRERARAARDLETRLEAFGSTRRAHRDEVACIEASLSMHRRELRYAEKELVRLGWTVEVALPVRLSHHDPSGEGDVSFDLLETGFYPQGSGG